MDNIVSANKLRNQNAILNPKENDDQKALFLKEKQEFEKEKALFLKERQKTLEENEETIINKSLKNKETKKGKQDK
ncbi:hypothetical protein THJ038_17260 [Campylobacter jejuni]|nr:hypothetical protein THJ029_17300 [Campylobacter jejuni]GKY03069.1 hypothetical protein THJ038_17260 [Campylobacter jejuni]